MRLEELYDRYRAELVLWATGMTQDRAAAEDLVQDAFLRALPFEELFDSLDEKQARAWLYRTAKNRFVDTARKRGRERLVESPPERTALPEGFAEAEWALLLDKLPYPDGTLLWLHTVEGVPSKELGKRFGLAPGTVRSKLHFAKKRLYRLLGGKNDV